MSMLEFFVPSNRRDKKGNPAPLDGLNELIRAEKTDWRYGNRIKRENGLNAQASCIYAMRASGWKCPRGKCLVTLTFVEPHRRRDPDNILGGAKFILDGITKKRGLRSYGAGALEDDSQRWVELRFGPILVDKENPGCWVRIEGEEDGVQEPSGRRD